MSEAAQSPGVFARLPWRGRAVQIEHGWVGASDSDAPTMVFLHEGLGSLAQWRDFPARLCAATGCRGLVYSRPGYGCSTPRAADEAWGVDFLHRQARELLPALLDVLGVDVARRPVWLFGHSDGASIALLYAAAFPDCTAGVVVLAPHVMVEDLSVQSIAKARDAYLATDLRQKLAKYHVDPDSAFWGWNDIWLHPAFKAWSIEREIESIRCPLLAMQGSSDEYGTLEQIRAIARHVPQTVLLELPGCGHAAHREQPERIIAATVDLMARHAAGPVQ